MQNGNVQHRSLSLCLWFLFYTGLVLGITSIGSQAKQPVFSQQPNLDNNRIRSLIVHGRYILAGLSGGGEVYRSEDQGQNWKLMQSGVGRIVYKFGKAGETLFAGTLDGLYRSTDNGQTWDLVSNNGMPGLRGNAAAIGHNGKVFAGTNKGVYRSTDGGINWTAAKSGLEDQSIHWLGSIGQTLLAGTDSGLFASANDGENWQQGSNQFRGGVRDIVSIGSILYVAGGGVFMSSNGGQTWVELKYNSSSLLNVSSLALVGKTIFAATRGSGRRIYRLTNSSWEFADSGLPLTDVYGMVGSGSVLLAGLFGKGIYRSTDLGQSWTMANRGLSISN